KASQARFLEELQTFQPPELFTSRLPRNVVRRKLLFDAPVVRSGKKKDEGFTVKLKGQFKPSEDYWQTAIQSASWILEIVAAPGQRVKYRIAPTERARAE